MFSGSVNQEGGLAPHRHPRSRQHGPGRARGCERCVCGTHTLGGHLTQCTPHGHLTRSTCAEPCPAETRNQNSDVFISVRSTAAESQILAEPLIAGPWVVAAEVTCSVLCPFPSAPRGEALAGLEQHLPDSSSSAASALPRERGFLCPYLGAALLSSVWSSKAAGTAAFLCRGLSLFVAPTCGLLSRCRICPCLSWHSEWFF